ncbi:DgyrCDS13343 [Dimorphilus gyrociliatus]|uniref:DgyrCDS13343 n=1 Tax=Dimorphilus gyrociliatus TaxID=2664684 RepID=A0A7I8WAD5_9ANNE|nr:DgyrCDS13343 [Dimorphilus gyrociliatus]
MSFIVFILCLATVTTFGRIIEDDNEFKRGYAVPGLMMMDDYQNGKRNVPGIMMQDLFDDMDKRSLTPVPFYCNKKAPCQNGGIGPKITQRRGRAVCVCLCRKGFKNAWCTKS